MECFNIEKCDYFLEFFNATRVQLITKRVFQNARTRKTVTQRQFANRYRTN